MKITKTFRVTAVTTSLPAMHSSAEEDRMIRTAHAKEEMYFGAGGLMGPRRMKLTQFRFTVDPQDKIEPGDVVTLTLTVGKDDDERSQT